MPKQRDERYERALRQIRKWRRYARHYRRRAQTLWEKQGLHAATEILTLDARAWTWEQAAREMYRAARGRPDPVDPEIAEIGRAFAEIRRRAEEMVEEFKDRKTG